MKTPAIIFTVFILAAATIIALNKNTPDSTPSPKAVVDDITAGSANQPLTSIEFKDSILHKGKISEGESLDVEFEFKSTSFQRSSFDTSFRSNVQFKSFFFSLYFF